MTIKLLKKKKFRKIVFWVVAVVIIISFGLAGQAYLLSGGTRGPAAGELFGKTVPLKEFNRHYKMTRFLALNEYGGDYMRVAPAIDFETQAWERLMLLKEAKRRGLKVSDNEVRDAVRSFPLFQSNGEFDYRLYQERLASGLLRMTPKEFERGVRETLMIRKLYSFVTMPVRVSDAEVRRLFHLRFDQAKALVAFFVTDAFLDVDTPIEETDLKNYFLTHRAAFIEPEAIKVGILFKPYPSTTATEDKPAQAKSPSDTPETGSGGVTADETKRDEIMREAEAIARLHQEQGVDPKEAAERFGGWRWSDTDFFTKDQPLLSPGWPLEIVRQLFDLKKGDWVGPFETERGVSFAKLIERRPQRSPAYPDVRRKVLTAYRKDQARRKAHAAAERFIERLRSRGQPPDPSVFRRLAEEAGAIVMETPLFKREDYLPGLGIARSFKEEVFRLDERHRISDPVAVQSGVLVAFLLDKKIADESLFEAHAPSLKQELLMQKRNLLFNQFFAGLKKRASLVSRLDELNQ